MPGINLNVTGVDQVKSALASLSTTQAKKAVMLWTNWVGLEAQGEMRRQLPARFSFRGTREGFEKAIVFSSARMKGERKLEAELKVGGPGYGQSRTQKLGVILARHEEAGARTQSDEMYYDGRGRAFRAGFFLPAAGLRTATSNPPKGMYPRAIGAAIRRTPEGVTLAKGTKKGSKKRGTGVSFFATRDGIFRRRHTSFGGRVDVQAVWWFRGRVRTPARLGLWETAQRTTQSRAVSLGLQAVDETLFRATL